jgi:hypothetical protein
LIYGYALQHFVVWRVVVVVDVVVVVVEVVVVLVVVGIVVVVVGTVVVLVVVGIVVVVITVVVVVVGFVFSITTIPTTVFKKHTWSYFPLPLSSLTVRGPIMTQPSQEEQSDQTLQDSADTRLVMKNIPIPNNKTFHILCVFFVFIFFFNHLSHRN